MQALMLLHKKYLGMGICTVQRYNNSPSMRNYQYGGCSHASITKKKTRFPLLNSLVSRDHLFYNNRGCRSLYFYWG